MSLQEKESIVDEIFNEQPNLLASVLVQPQMGNSLENIDVLLNILIVAHISLKESGVKLRKITESLQESEMAKFVVTVNFSEGLDSSGIVSAIGQYIASQREKYLLVYAFNEMNNAGFCSLKTENYKYLIMAGINIVSCISAGKLA
ncbi:MAG: hypothetical protein JKY01_06925 [Pseudomonadales bacterium]|nr:hypothetical protein [Pseudomonadales bacterium]